MKRLRSTPFLVLAALGAAAAARADQNAPGPHRHPGFALHRMEKCLETADLSPTTRANVDSALTSGKPILAADRAALKAAHDKMETDLSNGADKAVLGLDVLDLDAARTKMKTDAATIHDQLLAQLSADEQQALQSCVSAAHHSGRGPAGATESATP